MQFKLYSVLDVKAGAYLPPIFLANDAQAVRAFGDACNNEKAGFAIHPEDYSFHCLGMFDDNSGKIEGLPAPIFLARATDFIKPAIKEFEK